MGFVFKNRLWGWFLERLGALHGVVSGTMKHPLMGSFPEIYFCIPLWLGFSWPAALAAIDAGLFLAGLGLGAS